MAVARRRGRVRVELVKRFGVLNRDSGRCLRLVALKTPHEAASSTTAIRPSPPMLKKIFTTENITTFVLVMLASYVGVILLPNVIAKIKGRTASAS